MANKRTKFLCLDCNIDTGKIHEHYFIHTPLWLSINKTINGMLCISCLEKRLNRILTKDDFPQVHVNDPKRYKMSQLLLSRIRE